MSSTGKTCKRLADCVHTFLYVWDLVCCVFCVREIKMISVFLEVSSLPLCVFRWLMDVDIACFVWLLCCVHCNYGMLVTRAVDHAECCNSHANSLHSCIWNCKIFIPPPPPPPLLFLCCRPPNRLAMVAYEKCRHGCKVAAGIGSQLLFYAS